MKTNRTTHLCCLFLTFLFLTPFAVAQERVGQLDVASNQKKKSGPTFRIACWSAWTKSDLYIGKSKKKMVKVDIFDMSYSKKYPYTSGQPLRFYKKNQEATGKENPYTLAMSVNIPASCKKPLVMLVLGEEGVRHMVYDLDAKKFPYGTYKVVNFTSVNLLTIMGGDSFSLKPKCNHFVKLKSRKKNKAVQCRVAVKSNGEVKLVYSSMMMNRSDKRMLLFFYPSKDEGGRMTVKCRSLVDFSS